jgi:hypothetical protein
MKHDVARHSYAAQQSRERMLLTMSVAFVQRGLGTPRHGSRLFQRREDPLYRLD